LETIGGKDIGESLDVRLGGKIRLVTRDSNKKTIGMLVGD